MRGDPLADVLHGYARTYRMEKIRELLEEKMAAAKSSPPTLEQESV
jgi:hypothetical protein